MNEFAVRMFENGGRGIGQKGKERRVVLALKEKQIRIETGYDLEEFITDGFAGETIRDVMRPAFQRGEYGPGLLAGATRSIEWPSGVSSCRMCRANASPSHRRASSMYRGRSSCSSGS